MNQFILKRESWYAFTKDISDDIVNAFSNQFSTESIATLPTKSFNPEDILLQHLAVKEEVIKVKVWKMRNGNITDTSTSVDNRDFFL